MPARYYTDTGGDVSLGAGTAKTVLSFINAANSLFRVTEVNVSFDGTSSTAEPVVVQLMQSTEAGAGTATTGTAVQVGGPPRTVQGSTKHTFTFEPTALTGIRRWLVHPQTGLTIQFPLGREPEMTTTADAIVIRCTAPAAVNVQAGMEVEEG